MHYFSELCPPLYTDDKTKVRCYDQQKLEIKCSEASDGSSVKFECAPYYEPSDRTATIRYCYQGRWNRPAPQCIPGQPIVIYLVTINIFPNCTENCVINYGMNHSVTQLYDFDITTKPYNFDSITKRINSDSLTESTVAKPFDSDSIVFLDER